MNEAMQVFADFEALHPESVSLQSYKRNEVILNEGEIEPYAYWVISGAVKVVHKTYEREQIIRFGYTNSLFASLPAFFNASKSQFDIIAIRATTLKRFEKNALLEFINAIVTRQQAFTKILENVIEQQIEREIDLLTTSPMERYQRVLARSPQLFQEIPAVHIANYLRMSPEHLSRLRKS